MPAPSRWTIAVWVAGLGALAGLAVSGFDALRRPGDIANPNATFHAKQSRPKRPEVKTVDWPIYGYDLPRAKNLAAADVGPPFHQRWGWDSGELIEFSPIVVDGTLYGMNNDAVFFALDADTGKVRWKKQPGALNASSPAYHKGVLYAVTLDPGQAFALRARDGKLLWRRPLPGRSESSPAIYKGKVIFGCECNTVFALDAKNGKVVWSTPTAGAVKAAAAVSDGKVYVGDYAGSMYAINSVNGDVIWESSGLGTSFGRAGRFYSAPVVAYGRVYASNVDGRVYSFVSADGATAWTQSTGDWIYSAVVAGEVGERPAVFTASFDHHAYAMDARTGQVIWSTDVGGIVSGSGSIVGDVYYVATLGGKTIGLDTDSGKQVFRFERGRYNPVVSDGQRLYLTGYSSINALDPRPPKGKRHRANKGAGDRGSGGGGGGSGPKGGGGGRRGKGATRR